MLRRALARALPLALLVALAVPAAASANELLDVVQNIQRNNLAGLDACAFTPAQLNKALGEIPNDLKQYTGDLERAIRRALQAHAAGACDKKAPTTTAPQTVAPPVSTTAPPPSNPGTGAPAPSVTAAPPAPPPLPVALRTRTGVPVAALTVTEPDSSPPAALIALAAVATGLGLLLLAIFAVRRLGLDPPWLRPMRHAFGEAGWRAGGTWEDFTDWLRLGR